VTKCDPNNYPRPPVYHSKEWWAGYKAGCSQYRHALQVMVAVLGSEEAVRQFLATSEAEPKQIR
jgi:hypothetical protein